MDAKQTLHHHLRRERESLLAALDGLSEREVRWPVTATGTNLLGLVKHVASVEVGYFGETFGRPYAGELPWFDEGAEVNADMWATAEESRQEIVDLHRACAAHSDATIEALDLDAPGRVPWWPAERADVTLQRILAHMVAETAGHAGHADIVRELLVGEPPAAGRNLPDQSRQEWLAYRRHLEQVAEGFAEPS